MTKRIRNPKVVQSKSRSHEVIEVVDGIYDVVSGTSGNVYRVCIGEHGQGATCNCNWGQYRKRNDRRSGCSHVIAVYKYRSAREGRRVSAWASETDAKRQHKVKETIGDGVILTKALA